MASLNINNHIKSSLEFVHRGTVVFLRYLEANACSVAHTSVEDLKRSVVRELAKIPQEHYRAAVDEFQRRLDMVIDAKGGHIEK